MPGGYGCGDLGPSARTFVDFLAAAEQSWWQVLPVGPTGFGGSPYQSPSAFAGNFHLISADDLCRDGLLGRRSLDDWVAAIASSGVNDSSVDFTSLAEHRAQLMRLAFDDFQSGKGPAAERVAFDEFRHREAPWLDEYAIYQAIRRSQRDATWVEWPDGLADRQHPAVSAWKAAHAEAVTQEVFAQFCFTRQFAALREYAAARGVRLLGDMPIFAAHDSADVWSRRELFDLDRRGYPRNVAGVPPDYFSTTGQRWGNPLYLWTRHRQDGFAWWIERLARAKSHFDLIRLDHFRGFEAYWSVPATEETAVNGVWRKGPGRSLFVALRKNLGELPLIAEDLGLITPEVVKLRDSLGLPGMRVLQFAFGQDDQASHHRPHTYHSECVVYTGTHDNDTTNGWYRGNVGTTRSATALADERRLVRAYLGTDGTRLPWDFIRLAWSSVASIAIAPLQDILSLGSEARMNTPGSAKGNWTWRCPPGLLTPRHAERLAELTMLYDRKGASSSQA